MLQRITFGLSAMNRPLSGSGQNFGNIYDFMEEFDILVEKPIALENMNCKSFSESATVEIENGGDTG